MEYEELVRDRRSIRGYKKDPVPKELIMEIIEVASGAPSSMNTQPWHFHVVAGEPLDRIRAGNTERMMAGAKPQREIPV
ncbi:MAG: nitroreductase family protein, partial [Acidimicrobiia bacterium]|nr:nitroreductase family protein [Acidimicrobiia bacterium]